MPKPVTIGNEIWFSSIDNNAKTSFTMSEQLMKEAADKLDRSGINYYAFSVGEAARICVNSADTDKLLSVLGDKTAGLIKPQSIQKPYTPPEKNIIGNAEYRYIPQKTYHSTDTDIALRTAYELEKQNIQYSGNVYNSQKTTLTVSKPDYKKLLEIEKQILYARNTTFNELIEKRSFNHEEVHHSESEQQLQSSSSERENDEVSRLKGSGQIRSDETEIHARGTSGTAERSSRIGETVSLSEPVREGGAVSDPTAGRNNDSDRQRIPDSREVGKSSENDRTEKQLPSGSRGNDQGRDDIQLNIVGNTPYKEIKDKIYYNNIVTEELYNKYIKSTIDELGVPYSGQVKNGMVTFTVSAEDALTFERFMNVARNLYLIESALTEKGFSDDQISNLRDYTADAAALDFIIIDTYLDPKYSNEQLSKLAEKAIGLKKINNIFSEEYANAHKELERLTQKFDVQISFKEKGFNEDQQNHLLAAIDKGLDISLVSAIENSFSVEDIDILTDHLISGNYAEAAEFVRNRDKQEHPPADTEDISSHDNDVSQTSEEQKIETPELTDKEKAFLSGDIVPFMAKSVLAWDEIEDLGYCLYEKDYIDRHTPIEKAMYGNGLDEPVLYDMAKRMQSGEDIRKELALALLGNQHTFITNSYNEFKVEYGDDYITAKYGNAERQISYEELGNAFFSLIENEYNDIVRDRTIEDLQDNIPKLPAETAHQLIEAFDKTARPDWENNLQKQRQIRRALYDILGDDEYAQKAFDSIADMKYNVKIGKSAEQLTEIDIKPEVETDNEIVWTPITETEDENGRATSYSTKYNGKFYWITQNADGGYDIEADFGHSILNVGEKYSDFPTRFLAEEAFEDYIADVLSAEQETEITEPFNASPEKKQTEITDQISLSEEHSEPENNDAAERKHEDVQYFADAFGINVQQLDALIAAKPTEDTVNQYGRLNALIQTVDREKAAAIVDPDKTLMPHHVNRHIFFAVRNFILYGTMPETMRKDQTKENDTYITQSEDAASEERAESNENSDEYRNKVSSVYEYEVQNNLPESERMTTWADGQPVPTAKPEYKDGIGISENLISDRYDEIKSEERSVSPDQELSVGDIIETEGKQWSVTKIDGDFSIYLHNLDENALDSDMAIIGNWKEKLDYRLIPKDEISADINRDFSQLSLFDEIPDVPEKNSPETNLPIEKDAAEKHNFHITEDQQSGGAKTRFHNNIEAIKTLKTIEEENRLASPEEQEVLAKYVGWGGLSQAFDEHNDKWSSEYKELKMLLNPEEYNAARASTTTSFYTSPVIIEEMYNALGNMGFKGGSVLEPSMGVGNFFGLMPEEMRNSTQLSGVELDSISGRISKQLYQNANIQIKGFEKTDFKDNSFDIAVGNVPFGDIQIADKRYDKHNFKIHDYFFAKTLDKVRHGGVVAFITSKGTLDKQNDSVRRYIAERADLIGAVRLPNNAFKSLAGTEVTSDILFLQKREEPVIGAAPEWTKLGHTADGLQINKYFEDHPEMILGKIVEGNKLYGNKDTMCVPTEGQDLKKELHQALAKLQGRIEPNKTSHEYSNEEQISGIIPANENIKNLSYAVLDNKLYYNNNSDLIPVQNSAKYKRIYGMAEITACVRNLLDIQLNGAGDNEIKSAQERLSSLYDSFTAKYGNLSDKANVSAFKDDISAPLLLSLEKTENGKVIGKADIFSKRTVRPETSLMTMTAQNSL